MNWRRYLPALVFLEGILIGLQLPKFADAARRRLAPLPGGPIGPPPIVPDPICPMCRHRTFELEHYGHTHIPASIPSPLAAPE